MNIKSRLMTLERALRDRLRGAMALTLSDWLKGGTASPKLERQLAERWAAPDDPLEAQADNSNDNGGTKP